MGSSLSIFWLSAFATVNNANSLENQENEKLVTIIYLNKGNKT